MTVENSKTVDFVSISKDRAECELTISDHLEWADSGEHIKLLQAKIYTYMDFISGGAIYSQYPKAKGKQLVLRVIGAHAPSERGEDFLRFVKDIVQADGVAFRYEVVADPQE
jgi:hypothetical protein